MIMQPDISSNPNNTIIKYFIHDDRDDYLKLPNTYKVVLIRIILPADEEKSFVKD